MTATEISIPPHHSPVPLALPPKPAYPSNGTVDNAPLRKVSTETKKIPPAPTKPKPSLEQRISYSNAKRHQTDSSPDASPRPHVKKIPFTKKLSLESNFPLRSETVDAFPHYPLSPTRSTSHLPSPPPKALKPRERDSSGSPSSSSPLTQRRSGTELDHKQSPSIARKPLVHNKSAGQLNTVSLTNNELYNSEYSGAPFNSDTSLMELPPKLPAKPEKNLSCNLTGNKNIIIVPRLTTKQASWSTNQSVTPLPPSLPAEQTEPGETRDRKGSESGERDEKKLHRTLPSRGTKKKKRPMLLHHTDGTLSQPSTPPSFHRSPVSVKTSNDLSPFNAQMAMNLSHSFDSLDSMESQGSADLASKKSLQIEAARKKKARLSGNTQLEEKKDGKMKRAIFKVLGVGARKERSVDQDPASSLSASISSPSLGLDNPKLLSVQSVPAKISLALNEGMKHSVDDSFVFENPSDNEGDPEPVPLTTITYDSESKTSSSKLSGSVSPVKRSRNSKPYNKPSTQLDSTPSSPNSLYPYSDFPYVFENVDSDTDSTTSDVDAFDDYDQMMDDSDNEMTEEEVNKAKMRTIARVATGISYSKCYYVAKEILSTEEAYVKKLHLVNSEFPEALNEASKKSGKTLVPDDTLKRIFSNLPELYQINSTFRDEMKNRLDNWTEKLKNDSTQSTQKIGDIMRRHAHFFKSYSVFISNFDNALKMLEELTKKNSSFASFLNSFQSLPKCASLPLSAHMLAIVQRIPRYKLLLEQYIKHLPEGSEDQEDSAKALELISEVANHVNENLRMMDNFNKMIEVLNKIDGDVSNMLVPSRQFIKEGELKKVCRKGLQVRAFFLFTDMLLHTSPPGPGSSTYSLHTRIPLAGMKVSDLEQAEDMSETDPLKHGFKIISAIRSFVVVPASHEEKEAWLSTLTKALSDLQNKMVSHAKSNNRTSIFVDTSLLDTCDLPLGSLAPVWIPDDSVSMCMMCYKKFTFARRRHHCRVCGKVLCGECSNYKTEIKYLSNKQARCCLACFESLTDNQQAESGYSISAIDEMDQSQVSLTENVESEAPRNRRTRLRKEHSLVPSHLIQAPRSEMEYQMRGNLEYSENSSSKFKHTRWVLLQGNVLYLFKKREDAAANQTIPIPGYEVRNITDTVFVLWHKSVNSRYFRAESKELADKWKKELSKLLLDTATDVSPGKGLEVEEPPLLRSRSATTSQIDRKRSCLNKEDDKDTRRNVTVHTSSKCHSTGGVAISCLDTRKLSDPTNPTDSNSQDVMESETKEDLTATITEDKLIESTD